jgi:hypothetical protein
VYSLNAEGKASQGTVTCYQKIDQRYNSSFEVIGFFAILALEQDTETHSCFPHSKTRLQLA